jgi:hypothetical protein
MIRVNFTVLHSSKNLRTAPPHSPHTVPVPVKDLHEEKVECTRSHIHTTRHSSLASRAGSSSKRGGCCTAVTLVRAAAAAASAGIGRQQFAALQDRQVGRQQGCCEAAPTNPLQVMGSSHHVLAP